MSIKKTWRHLTDKSYHNFKKLDNRYRRKLKRIIKNECRLYDYNGYGELVYAMMQNQYEYFIKGDNVWQADETRLEVASELAEAMTLFCEAEYLETEAWLEKNYETYSNWRFNGKSSEPITPSTIHQDAEEARLAFVIYFAKHCEKWWD